MSVGISWASHNSLIYTSELILCSTIRVHSATRQNIHMYPHLNSGVRLLLELYRVVVIKHVAFFTIWVKYWIPFNVPVYLWTFTPLFSEVVVVSDLNKNFVGSTNLAKKAQIGGLAYSYSPPSRRRSALRIRWRRESWKDWPPLRGLPTDPRSTDYPTDYPYGLPYGLPLRTTLKNQPNSFYGVQKYKKLTYSSYTIITARKTAAIFFSYISRPSLFHFAPFFTGRPPARTLFSTMDDR